jgi:hypothetical protein
LFTTFLETWRIESKTIRDSERYEGHTDMSTSVADGRLQAYTSQFLRKAKIRPFTAWKTLRQWKKRFPVYRSKIRWQRFQRAYDRYEQHHTNPVGFHSLQSRDNSMTGLVWPFECEKAKMNKTATTCSRSFKLRLGETFGT